jgi:hypothetical protein
VNETGWSGIEIRYGTQARVIGTNITNAGWSRLDCRYTDTPCTVETPPNLNCSCNNNNMCSSAPLNLLILQGCGDETIIHDIMTGSTYPTPMMSTFSSSLILIGFFICWIVV